MNDVIQRLWQRILTVVQRGRVTHLDDAGAVQMLQARVNALHVQDHLPRLAEYGFQSAPPVGSDVTLLCMAGNLSDGVVIATGHQTFRMRNLATGEVAISDDKGQSVYLSAAGIRIEAGALPMQINTTGGLTVNADTTFNGTVTANGHRIDQTHKHTGVTAGGALSGVVS